MNRLIQTLFILLVILFTTGCGDGSNKAKKAQVTITNYTTKTENSKSPTVADYKVAGFPDVSESNIHRVNSLLMEMPSDEVDTFEEIKVVIVKLLNNDIPPKIVILGSSTVTHSDGSIYRDLGATASDDRDGNLTSYIHIVSDVNSSKDGNYTVTYSVEDSAGNKVIVIREVNIVLDTSTSIVTPDNNDTKEPIISPIVTPDNNDTKEPIISPEHNVTKLIIEDAEDG
ncbi:MAG TPA: DUF5011 domain-containing protein, partial [Sulfurovum sp.]|nr:DUF5011 domain-containing protein [Sulfurovum sp.]